MTDSSISLQKDARPDGRPKILIIGANSKISEGIRRVFSMFSRRYQLHWVTRSESVFANTAAQDNLYTGFDILNRKQLKELCLRIQPDFIINTTAYTNVDGAEQEKKRAWEVNVQGVENLVAICRLIDAHLIHFSTDYIFDGQSGPYSEQDIPQPQSYYGKTKLAGENVCIGGHINCTIIRTNVLYGSTSTNKPDFVLWFLQQLAVKKKLYIVNDQYSNPTFIDDVAYLVEKIIRTRASGIINAGGADWISRFVFAQKIASIFKESGVEILPISTKELEQRAPRPLRGGLVSIKAETLLGMKFCGVESGLLSTRKYLQLAGRREWTL
jgi:dTDP-4-dehydrorhamnose reductase